VISCFESGACAMTIEPQNVSSMISGQIDGVRVTLMASNRLAAFAALLGFVESARFTVFVLWLFPILEVGAQS
jgi:hypothetical protein